MQHKDADRIAGDVDDVGGCRDVQRHLGAVHASAERRTGVIHRDRREGVRRDAQVGDARLHDVRLHAAEQKAEDLPVPDERDRHQNRRQQCGKHQELAAG